MSSDKVISYVHNEDGRRDEFFEDVSSVDCLNSPNGPGKTLIVRHSSTAENTTRENVDHMFGVQDDADPSDAE